MNIQDAIELHPGVENAKQIAAAALKDPKTREELWQLTYHEKKYISRIAAWSLEYCFLMNQEAVMPYIPAMVQRLNDVDSDSLRRHFLKMIWMAGVKPEHYDMLANKCFDWLEDAQRPVAVKMFSMKVLYEISNAEPDIKPELAALIEHQMPNGTPGIQNIGGKLLKKLYQQIG